MHIDGTNQHNMFDNMFSHDICFHLIFFSFFARRNKFGTFFLFFAILVLRSFLLLLQRNPFYFCELMMGFSALFKTVVSTEQFIFTEAKLR